MRELQRHHHLGGLQHLEQLALHAHPRHVLGRAGAGEDGVVLAARDLVELVEADDADRGEERVLVGGVEQAGDDRVRVLPDVAGLGVGRDVDQRGRQLEDLAEQGLDQEGLARAGRAHAQEVGLARQLAAIDAVDVDPLDPANVAVRHQAQRAPRRALAAVAVVLERAEHRGRRRRGQLAHELDEVLKPGLPVLLEVLHRLRFARHRSSLALCCGAS